MEKPSMIKPALIGGAIFGLLTLIPFLGALCCLWGLLGGAVAAMIYVKNSPVQITSGNGAGVGALAGFVGGVIVTVISTLIFMSKGGVDPETIAEQMRAYPFPIDPNAMKIITENFVIFLIFGQLFNLLLTVGISAVGGIIGVGIFEKRKDTTPPPPYPYTPPPGGPVQPPPSPYPPAEPGSGTPPPAAPYEPPQEPPQEPHNS
jgi:hypothetical protein